MSTSGAPNAETLEAEVKRLRELLLQAAKLAELGQHVAGIVHEMNQPLLGMKAFAQMLKKELRGDEAAYRKAAFLEEQAIVLEKLVGRLRKFTRLANEAPGGEVRAEEAFETVRAILAHRIRRLGAQVSFDAAEGAMLPMGAVHAQQVLLNLTANALDAIEGHTDPRVRVRVWEEEGEVRIEVADTGPGIRSEVIDRVLEPFFTTKPEEKGTGLGLAVVNEIVKAYGGRLQIGNGEAACPDAGVAGAVVRISLPHASK